MGMGTGPGCGYVLPVDKVRPQLEKVVAKDMKKTGLSFDELLTEYYYEQTGVVFDVNGYRVEAELYVPSDGDRYDDLEEGEMYLIFAEDNLFTRQKTDMGRVLEQADMFPRFAMWTWYG